MKSIKSVKRKYIIQWLTSLAPAIATVAYGILIDYNQIPLLGKLLLVFLPIITMIIISYYLLLKNYTEELEKYTNSHNDDIPFENKLSYLKTLSNSEKDLLLKFVQSNEKIIKIKSKHINSFYTDNKTKNLIDHHIIRLNFSEYPSHIYYEIDMLILEYLKEHNNLLLSNGT